MKRILLSLAFAAAILRLTATPGLTPALAAEESPRALVERGAWRQARRLVESRLEKSPDDAEALWLMSQVKGAFGDEKGAFELAEKAVSLDGKKPEYHLQLAEVCGQMAQKAGPLKGLGLGKRFKKEAEAALALDPRQIDARVDLMMFYLKAPGIAGGDKKKAKRVADEIITLDPVRGNIAQARFDLEQRDTARAAGSYRKAAELGATSYQAQIAAASFFAGSGQQRWDLVEKCARLGLEIDPQRAGAYSLLAAAYAHLERWSELDAILAAAESNLPGNLGAYYQAGRMLLIEGHDPERAERCFRKYLTAEPEGNAPSHAHAHWRLGLVLEKQGRRSEALAELETALKINPQLDEAKKDLKRLKRA